MSAAADDKIIQEGHQAEIECHPESKTLIVWFRILDNSGMEFIASFSNSMQKDTEGRASSNFNYRKISRNIIILQSFRRDHDSGLYTCASLYKGKELKFGKVTRLVAGESRFVHVVERKKKPFASHFDPNVCCQRKPQRQNPPRLPPSSQDPGRRPQRARVPSVTTTRVDVRCACGWSCEGERVVNHTCALQGRPACRCSARRSSWARWRVVAAFCLCS